MTTNRQAATAAAAWRKTAIAAGVLFLMTHVTSLGAFALYSPVLNDTGYIAGSGDDTQVVMGAFFEIILAMAVIGTAVALYPVVKRENEGIALGYVGLRTLEAAIIAAGVIPLLAVVTLRQVAAGSGSASLVALGSGFVALHNWTVVAGPGLVCGVNTVLIAYLMYRSRLVPRFIPVLGLAGGVLVFAYNTALMFGMRDRMPAWVALGVIPIFAWEVSLAIRLIVVGFNSTAAVQDAAGIVGNERMERGVSQA